MLQQPLKILDVKGEMTTAVIAEACRGLQCCFGLKAGNGSHLANGVKAVQLGQQLHERALNLPVCARALAEPPASHSSSVGFSDCHPQELFAALFFTHTAMGLL